jgi:SAM-dependent methyltransferase
MTDGRLRQRAGFDRVADVYDRVRPTYPPALFADLAALTGVGPGSRVLEIGCGTGQASVALAELGCDLLAVELGPHLAELAARRLAPFGSARVVVADFDRWTPEVAGFDLVFSATAFHWLDPATRFDRTADLLAPGGSLAVVETHHIAGGTERFFADVQSCYRRFDRVRSADDVLRPADQVPHGTDFDTGRYQAPVFRRHEWTAQYRTADYLDLIGTYSGTLDLPPLTAAGLLRCIGQLIDGRYDGRVAKRYLAELRLARRTP